MGKNEAYRKSVLIFIDGTICDTRHRYHLIGQPDFHCTGEIQKDVPVPGSVECLKELAAKYNIIYIGARSLDEKEATSLWLWNCGFPQGDVILAQSHLERLAIVQEIKEWHGFAAGIGDWWDDNELHLEIGCMSIILKEFEGNWDTVRKYLLK